MADEQLYKCPLCGWIGTENQMAVDHIGEPAEEYWSNWICPGCSEWWQQLDDYEKIDAEPPKEVTNV